MKLVHAVVSTDGFRDPTRNRQRLRVLHELLQLTTANDAQLLVVPAGFLAARDQHERDQNVQEAADLVAPSNVTLIGGVDIVHANSKRSREIDDLVATHRLPYFGFAVSISPASLSSNTLWRQVSTNSTNGDIVRDDSIPDATRLVNVTGKSVAVLICGELFNQRARQSISSLQADMIIDLGHSGMGQGLIPAMRKVARLAGCPVVHSQHVKSYGTTKIHFVDSAAQQSSQEVTANPLIRDNGVWAGWALRSVYQRDITNR